MRVRWQGSSGGRSAGVANPTLSTARRVGRSQRARRPAAAAAHCGTTSWYRAAVPGTAARYQVPRRPRAHAIDEEVRRSVPLPADGAWREGDPEGWLDLT